ncbi:MAG TPA: hypothetical protein VD971_00450 [Phycisphaerales bacterium]|nr:hypothetical protein [Phycisphaerales bacterium]
MSPHEVAIVVDPDFGEALRPLSRRMHVWTIQSPTNQPVIDLIWQEPGEYSLECGVTSFPREDEPLRELFADVVADVELHHGVWAHDPPWTVLHSYGIGVTDHVRETLAEYGVDQIEERPDHFVATRPRPSGR